MYREWMYNSSRLSETFIQKVSKFVPTATKHAFSRNHKGMHCPFSQYKNERVWFQADEVKSHLLRSGFVEGYMDWTCHDETEGVTTSGTSLSVQAYCVSGVNIAVGDHDDYITFDMC